MKIFKINKIVFVWIFISLLVLILLIIFSLEWFVKESIEIQLQKENNQLFAIVDTRKANELKLNNFYTIDYKNYTGTNQIVEIQNLNNGKLKLLLREKQALIHLLDDKFLVANLTIKQLSFFDYIFKLIK